MLKFVCAKRISLQQPVEAAGGPSLICSQGQLLVWLLATACQQQRQASQRAQSGRRSHVLGPPGPPGL